MSIYRDLYNLILHNNDTWNALIFDVMIVGYFFSSQTCSCFIHNKVTCVVSVTDLCVTERIIKLSISELEDYSYAEKLNVPELCKGTWFCNFFMGKELYSVCIYW